MPHEPTWNSLPVRRACMRSAAKTPNWQVTDESTSMIVFVRANGTSSLAVSAAHRPGEVLRSVK
jgi:hypothetical protein